MMKSYQQVSSSFICYLLDFLLQYILAKDKTVDLGTLTLQHDL